MAGPTNSDAAAAAVVERLAVFAKAAAIYPLGHNRIGSAADALVEILERTIEPGRWLSVRVAGVIEVGGSVVECASTNVSWLREQFKRSSLAGLEISPAISRRALLQFAEQLKSSSNPAAGAFADEWRHDHPSLRPLRLTYSGESSGRAALESVVDLEAESDVLDIKRQILRDESTVERLRALERAVAEERSAASDERDTGTLDLLADIIAELPSDVLGDIERVRSVVKDVLSGVERGVAQRRRSGSGSESGRIMLGARNVARDYFARGTRKGKELPAEHEVQTERAEDLAIDGDPEQLRREFERLPQGYDFPLPLPDDPPGKILLEEELLGTHLHLACVAELDGVEDRLVSWLSAALDKPTASQLEMLEHYLHDDEGLGDERVWTIARMLLRAGHGRLLTIGEALGPRSIAAMFPDNFSTLIDALPGRPKDIKALGNALAIIGDERIEAAVDELVEDGLLNDRDRVEKLLAVADPVVLPFVRALATRDDDWVRACVLSFLRAFDVPDAESAALRCVVPASELPISYLIGLCECAASEKSDVVSRHRAEELLRQFIENTADRAELLEQRIRAIRELRLLPSAEVRQLLGRLSKKGRILNQTRAARRIRKAAAETLKAIEE